MLNALEAFKRGLDVFLRWFCIVLFVVLVMLVTWQVFVRQVLPLPNQEWTEVLARIVFIWQGLIGAAYVIGEKDDVAIDFLVNKLPGGGVKAMQILAHSIVAFFAIWVMCIGGGRLAAATMDDIVQLLPVSQGVIYLALPIAGGLIAVYSVLHIIQTIVKPAPTVVDPNEMDLSDLQEESI